MPRPAVLTAPLAVLALAGIVGGCGGAEPAPEAGPAEGAAPQRRTAQPSPADSAARTPAPRWLTPEGATAGEPSACVDDAGRLWIAHLAWASGGPTLELTCLAAEGDGWSSLGGARVAGSDPRLGHARLAPATDGALVVYEAEAGVVARAARWSGDDVTLGELELVASGALLPDVARAGDDQVVCWQATVEDAYDVFVRRRTPDGAWSEPRNLSSSPWDDWCPRVASGADGVVWTAWDAWIDGSFDVVCAGPLDRDQERRLRLTDAPGHEAHPDLAVDGEGRPWIAFEQARDFGVGGPLRDARELRLVTLDDDGVRDVPLDGWPARRGQLPRIVSNGEGLTLAARVDDPPYQPSDHAKRKTRQGLHHAWRTWTLALRDGAWEAGVVTGSIGDNEQSTELVVVGDAVHAVFAGDDRRSEFESALLWGELLERDWRVGVGRVGPIGDRPGADGSRAIPSWPEGVTGAPARDDRFLFGDLHRHTQLSRCAGTTDGTRLDNYRYARGPGRLDFLSINDHLQHLTEWNWWRSLRDAERFHAPPSLVVLPGLERFVMREGHQNLVYMDRDAAARDEAVWDVTAGAPTSLAPPEVVSIPHMLSSVANPWPVDSLDPALHTVVELFQDARGSYEGPDAPLPARDMGVAGPFLVDLLPRGPFGLIASSDHGESGGSLAVVEGAPRTRAGVLEALAERRTGAATGYTAVTLDLDGLRGGASGSVSGRPVATVELHASDAPAAAVELLVDGQVVARRGGSRDTRELLVLSARLRGSRADEPVRLSIHGGRIVDLQRRRGAVGEGGFERLDERRVALRTGSGRLDLALGVEWTEGPRQVGVRFGVEGERVGFERLPVGATHRFQSLRGKNIGLWRVGPAFDESPTSVRFEGLELRPGSAAYARVAYADGNCHWTSPVWVTEIDDQ